MPPAHRAKRVLPFSILVLGAALLSAPTPVRSDDAAADCSALRQAYAVALSAAQVCEPGAGAQCQASRPVALDDACHCQASVNEGRAADLDALAARYRERGCPAAAGLCNRRCLTPASRCVARAGGSPRCG